MFAWINFAVLLFASLLFLYFYVRSASPAGREKIIRPRAYQICFHDRLISGAFELVITINHILYYLIYFPIFILLCYVEEQDLLLRYGDPYAEYCKRTGAFWPKRS